jgi:hypothetical protein
MSRDGNRVNTSYTGKVVDVWTYEVVDLMVPPSGDYKNPDEALPQRVVNKKVSLEVRVHKTTRESTDPPHPTTAVEVSVTNKELKINLVGTDLEALRVAAWGLLDKKFEIEWHQYYIVVVKHERPYEGQGTGLVFSFDTVYKGITWDGKLLLKRPDWRRDRIEVWPGEFKDRDGRVQACIPATDETEAALQEFGKRINTLRVKLAEFLRPDQIVATLANLRTLALLPASNEQTENEH